MDRSATPLPARRRRAAAAGAGAPPAGFRGTLALAAALIAVGALVALVHWPVLRAAALSFDDTAFVSYNPLVTRPGWESTRRFFTEVLEPSTVRGYYLPLSMTSLMLDVAAGGRADDLFAFHRTSLALHVLCVALLVLLLHRIFGSLLPAALGGLLFGLHPLTVEPVAWVAERKTLLATLFAFGSILAYVESRRRRSRRAWIASFSLFALALLSKPTVLTLPLLLLLLDFWPLRRLSVAAWLEKWPFYLLSLGSGVIALISHQRTAGIDATTPSDLLHWPLHAGHLLAFYLGKILWPAKLSCVYPPPEPFSLSNPAVLSAVAVTLAVTVGGVLLVRRSPGPLTGWLFFVIAIAPTLGLVKYSWVIAADKYVYFPALGLLLPVAAAVRALERSKRFAAIAPRAALIAAAALALSAEARGVRATLHNWSDTLTLVRHLEAVAPESPAVHNQLGVLLAGTAAADEAVGHLRRAIELMPGYGEAHYNLGIALAGRGQLDEAIGHFRAAQERMPDDPDAAYNLGITLALAGRPGEAEAPFRRALRLKPDYVEALDQLGGALVAQGRAAAAVEPLERAVALEPARPELHLRLAMALLLAGGREAAAAERLRQAIRLRADDPEMLNALAWLLATSPDSAVRKPDEALLLAARAVELTGQRDPRVLDTLAAAEAAAGRYREAAETARRALALAARGSDPSLAEQIRDRMERYRRGLPFREPRGTGPTVPSRPRP